MTIRDEDPLPNQLKPAERKHLMAMIKCGVSRRDFMAYTMAAGATIAASSALFANLSEAVAQTPKRGGRVVFADQQHGPADTLDPALSTGAIDYFRGRMFYSSLTRLTDALGWEPELAEEVISNDDATVWTFKIRKGVTFHDGKTLDADDVVYSMNRHLGENSVSLASALVSMVDRWEKVNKYEVRAMLATPNADLPIALGTFHFKIVQDGQTDFSTTSGSGPYKVKEFKPGVRAIGVRNENYWEEGGYLDELEHFGIGDETARLNAFLAGDINAMANVPAKAIAQIEGTPGKKIWSIESGRYVNIVPRQDIASSSNPHLAKAMQYLQDRQRLLKGVLKGHGGLGNDHPIGPAYFDHSPDIPQRELDPDKAAYHFKESGIGDAPIEVIAADVGPGAVDQCLFMQREGRKIGMNFDVKQVTTDGYWGAVWLKAPICVATWNMRPTANIMMTLGFHSEAAWNEARWSNPQFDQLLETVRSVTDPAKRKQMYHDLQMMIHEGNGMSIPAHLSYVDGIDSNIKGLTHVPLDKFGGGESPPKIWLDA